MTSTSALVRPRAGLSRPLPVAPARVLVVEALPLAGLGLHTMIDGSRELASCGATSSMATAVSVVGRVRPDIVLVDSSLDPEAGGARAILATDLRLGVIGLVRDDSGAAAYVRAATRAGVRGLIPRSAPPAVIMSTIRAVRAGGKVVDPALTALQTEQKGKLSDRQAAVLELISRGNANATIAETLFVSVETVRTHVKAILQRLDARDRAHAVARGYQLGLLDPGSTK
ncbi:LuxR C-terminal-related transcriptional regulator [Actinokineospora sp. HUAS TT18]|uniref:LuxR C-terminal-related transcriptional regulator n=1 Tax=Actinokineospora sp. HUAS TT18 TaxID=3447451 RepID=UPI003F528449